MLRFMWKNFFRHIEESKLDKTVKSWKDLTFWSSQDWKNIQVILEEDKDYLPDPKNVFRALWETPLDFVRAVIVGQDPYYTPALATGLAFSIKPFVRVFPPSLVNIFKEYHTDTGYPYPTSGDLSPWATAGVLLLNTVLTVRPSKPLSHANIGWQVLTNQILEAVVQHNKDAVFILWGKEAQKILIDNKNTIKPKNVVMSAHPSPHAATKGFFGSRPFARCNALLQLAGKSPINWRLP